MRTHRLLTGAAVSVIVLSGVGLAAITGVLPGSRAERPAETAKSTYCGDCGVVVAAKQFQVNVRMADGTLNSVTFSSQHAWKAGERVWFQDGKLISHPRRLGLSYSPSSKGVIAEAKKKGPAGG
jgi:hypothetical protein